MKKKGYNKKLWGVAVVSIIIVFGLWFFNYYYAVSLENNDRGTFGDMFGAVNAVFSGLAFAGIIIALYLQSIDLKNQFNEIQQTNKEFRIQNNTMELQKFDNRFFHLLSLHHQIVSDIDGSNELLTEKKDGALWHYIKENEHQNYDELLLEITNGNVNTSRDVFKYWLNLLYNLIEDNLLFLDKKELGKYPNKSKKNINANKFDKIDFFYKSSVAFNGVEIESKFESIYGHIYRKLNADFGHYFRNLYRMVKLVDETTFNKKDKIKDYWKKYEYISIIRAQLSDYETEWLFFNCLTKLGKEKFKPLIEKYAILKMIRTEDSVYAYFKDLYKPSAFKKYQSVEIQKILD